VVQDDSIGGSVRQHWWHPQTRLGVIIAANTIITTVSRTNKTIFWIIQFNIYFLSLVVKNCQYIIIYNLRTKNSKWKYSIIVPMKIVLKNSIWCKNLLDNKFHREVAERNAEDGVNVFFEKPIVIILDNAIALSAYESSETQRIIPTRYCGEH